MDEPVPAGAPTAARDASGSARRAFALVTSLFFLWGLAYGLLDVLNKHFQETLGVTRARSALLQAAYFGAYFLMAIPAALFMQRAGYKRGILLGLALYAIGALLFVPATHAQSFEFFLCALFVLACGLACLETAANPYVTILGPPGRGPLRLNLSQSFNGLGQCVGPWIGGSVFFAAAGAQQGTRVQGTYVVIAIVVLIVAALIARTPLPEARDGDGTAGGADHVEGALRQPHFVGAVIAQFFYVAAQVGVGAFFINYVSEYQPGATSQSASFLLSASLLGFLAGRFISTALLARIPATTLLGTYATLNVLLALLVVAAVPGLSIVALVLIFLFMSMMFPTIFALGIRQLGAATKRGASLLIMSIVGGAILPWFMGRLADARGTASAYLLPAACFAIVAWYGWRGARIVDPPAAPAADD